LELLYGIEVFVFPSHIAQSAVIPLDVRLICGTSVTADDVGDA
jgi:hypothetical protein